MEISLDKINSRSDPYQLFLDSIRSSATLRRYKNQLHAFLKLIVLPIYWIQYSFYLNFNTSITNTNFHFSIRIKQKTRIFFCYLSLANMTIHVIVMFLNVITLTDSPFFSSFLFFAIITPSDLVNVMSNLESATLIGFAK